MGECRVENGRLGSVCPKSLFFCSFIQFKYLKYYPFYYCVPTVIIFNNLIIQYQENGLKMSNTCIIGYSVADFISLPTSTQRMGTSQFHHRKSRLLICRRPEN